MIDKSKEPKSKNWNRFKTFLYKNAIPKEKEDGALIDVDIVFIFVKQIMLNYEEKLKNK